jgi:hypothetical protein
MDGVNPDEVVGLILQHSRLAIERGDRCEPVRQAEYARLTYERCTCPHHSCRGCATIAHLGALLDDLAPHDLTDAERYNASQTALAAWEAEGRLRGAIVANVRHKAAQGHPRPYSPYPAHPAED